MNSALPMLGNGRACFTVSAGFGGQGFDLLRKLQPALFQLIDFSVDGTQLLAGFHDIATGQAGRGQLFFQRAALGIELGQRLVDLFQLFLERLGLFGQLLTRCSSQASGFLGRPRCR
jgi:hypothetical protein